MQYFTRLNAKQSSGGEGEAAGTAGAESEGDARPREDAERSAGVGPAVFLSPGLLTGTHLPDMCGWKSGDIKIKLQACIKTEPFAGSRND